MAIEKKVTGLVNFVYNKQQPRVIQINVDGFEKTT